MDREEKLACLRLIRTPNIGPMTFSLLLQRYGSAIEALRAVPELAKRGGRSLKPAGRALAEAELQANEDAGASLLFKGAGDYPARLAQFDDAPPVLSVRGSPHLLSRPSVGIVGARNASINAQRLAQSLAEDLAAEGYVIVSGLARGIDAAAHNGALAGGTVAVIAGGIDIIYPPENADLHESIAQTGLLVAEMPPGTQPTPRHFPIRNRIIGALALGVVVVEAAERSGSLITVARPAAATLPDPADWRQARLAPGKPEEIDRCRSAILEGLGPEGTDIDEVIRWCGMPASTVLAAILELEIAGRLTRHHGNRICLVVIR